MQKLTNVPCVPDLAMNLLSVSAVTYQKLQVCFNKEDITINIKNKIVAKGVKRNNIYELLASMTQVDVGTSRLCHEWFGYLSMQTLSTMQRSGTVVYLLPFPNSIELYEACMKGEQNRQPFPQESSSRVEAPL